MMLLGAPTREALAAALELARRRPNQAILVDECCARLQAALEELTRLAEHEVSWLVLTHEEAKVAWGAVFCARHLVRPELAAQLAILERRLLDLYVELAHAEQTAKAEVFATVNADASKSELLGTAVAA